MDNPHGWEWFEKLERGEISDAEFAEFQDELRKDPELRKQYRKFVNMRSQLEDMAQGLNEDAGSWSEKAPKKPALNIIQFAGWATAAAAVLFILFIQKPQDGKVKTVEVEKPKLEEKAEGVAVITKLVGVKFKNQQYSSGEAIGRKPFEIESGIVQLEFYCGATVVLEGPAKLEPVSAWKAVCHSGKLRAHVPPAAQGFTVKIGDTDVVDLGTEFAIDATGGKHSVQVFDGEVELNSDTLSKHSITAGKAVNLDDQGNVITVAAEEKKFIGMNDLQGIHDEQDSASYNEWLNYSGNMSKDPRVIAYYNFTQKNYNRRVLYSQKDKRGNGAVVGAAQAEGRWPGKSALTFKQPGDRVRINIDGDYTSLTFSCWTKIDSLDRLYNSLYLTDAYELGEVHWQIMNDGRLFFSTKVRDHKDVKAWKNMKGHEPAFSPKFWKPEYTGKWIHLAARLDVDKQIITHFVNGKVFSTHPIHKNYLVTSTRFGTGEIGNWGLPNRPDKYYAIRNLNGAIDEFAIFSEALSDQELLEIYNIGNPYK